MAGKVMEKRTIGSSDMNVSVIALGCFSFGGDHAQGSQMGASFAKLHTGVWGEQKDEDTTNCIAAALKNGINFFDTAEMYGDGYSEDVMGRAFKEIGAPRSSYYLATKVSEANLEPKKLREHLEASLARLQTDYVDLYQIHWHSRAGLRSERYPDRPLTEEVPLADTLAELSTLQKEGKIRHIGVCNFGVEDLKAALATGVPIVSNQICYNLLWRGIEPEVLPFCVANNISILPWSPLGQGLLVGTYKSADEVLPGRARSRLFCGSGPGARPQQRHGEPGLEKETFEAIAAMKAAAEAQGISLINASLAWLREKQGMASVLMGARNERQLLRNLECLDVVLSKELTAELTAAGEKVKAGLGTNLDPYESAETSRIR